MINRIQSAPPYLFSAAILAIILVLTLSPDMSSGGELKIFPHFDRLVHFLMFGLLSGAIVFDSNRKGNRVGFGVFLLSVLLSAGCGGVVELLQEAMKLGRSGDWYDFLADFSGALVFALISIYICNKWKKTNN